MPGKAAIVCDPFYFLDAVQANRITRPANDPKLGIVLPGCFFTQDPQTKVVTWFSTEMSTGKSIKTSFQSIFRAWLLRVRSWNKEQRRAELAEWGLELPEDLI